MIVARVSIAGRSAPVLGLLSAMVDWSSDFEVGIPEIDDHHRAMVEMVDRLWQALVRNASEGELGQGLDELEQYALNHFALEEAVMERLQYPGFEDHRANHRAFARRISHARQAHRGGEPLSLPNLRLLKNWLMEHMTRADRDYADFVLGRVERRSPLRRFFRRFAV